MKIINSLRLLSTRIMQSSTTWSLRVVYPLFGSIEFKGLKHIDHNKRYLFVANHKSFGDVYAIFIGMSLINLWRCSPTRFMTSSHVYYTLLRPVIMLGGGFPTKRSRAHYSAVHQSIDYLRNNQNVVIFPEGGRVQSKSSRPHTGVVRIIEGCDFPIEVIAVHIDWQKRGRKRHLRVVHSPCTDTSSAEAIMDAIYAL